MRRHTDQKDSWHGDFNTACPNAFLWGNFVGSNGAASFAFFLDSIGRRAREVIKIPLVDEIVVLILDTGGGALLHVSMRIMRVALLWRFRLFFLLGYSNRALMALDQQAHQIFSQEWKCFRQAWSSRSDPLTLFVALRAVSEFAKKALSENTATRSWKRVGCQVGKPWDRDMLLVTRANEIVSSTCAAGPSSMSTPSALTEVVFAANREMRKSWLRSISGSHHEVVLELWACQC